MQKALNRLHRQILAHVNQGGNSTLGALIIVGNHSSSQEHGSVTSFSGGNTEPIVMGLVKEMQRDPGILASVRMALYIVENNLLEKN